MQASRSEWAEVVKLFLTVTTRKQPDEGADTAIDGASSQYHDQPQQPSHLIRTRVEWTQTAEYSWTECYDECDNYVRI